MLVTDLHRFARSLLVAIATLLLIVGGAFAHGALAPASTTLVTGPAVASSDEHDDWEDADEPDAADEDAADDPAEADDDNEQADEDDGAPTVETPKAVAVKVKKADKNERNASRTESDKDDADEADEDDGDEADHDDGEQGDDDAGEHDDGGGEHDD